MAILMRRGRITDLDASKLRPGEFAVSTDGTVTICYAAGKTKTLLSSEDIENIENILDIENIINDKLQEMVADGTLAGLTVEDASIGLNKLSADLKEYLENILTEANKYSDSKTHWSKEIVDSLPEKGKENTFYFLKVSTGIYRTYIYNGTGYLNTSGADMSGYYTSEEVDEIETALRAEIAAIDTSDVNQLGLAIIDGFLYVTNKGLAINTGVDISQFGNVNEEDLADYAKRSWVTELVNSMTHFTKEIVDSLPDTGNENTFYLIWDEEKNYYNEYWYVGGKWDQIGSTQVDLSGYYTSEEVDALLSSLSDTLKSELANSEQITTLQSQIEAANGKITILEATLEELGALVSDVVKSDTGVTVYYRDGSTKVIDLNDTAVRMDDIDKSDTGIVITYSDGSTKEIEISGGGGTGTSGNAVIKWVNGASAECVYGDECNLVFIFTATDAAGDTVGNGAATWYVGGIKKAESTAIQGTNTFDIGPYLTAGTNNVRLSISVDTGGENNTVTTKSATVNAVNMYVEWEYNDATVNKTDLVLRWTPYGNLEKTTHILIDGTEMVSSTTTRSGTAQSAVIPKMTHGSHMAELYVSAEVNGVEIKTASEYHDLIFADDTNNAPIISCSYPGGGMVQYNTLSIPVMVYDPAGLTTAVALKENGETIAAWENVDRTVHYWNYTPSTAGAKTLQICCGGTVKTIIVTVSALDIDNEEIGGYSFRMKASDFAGNDALQSWESSGVTASFSDNFDWNNGGIQTETDENGNIRQYICVKANTTMTVNHALFADDAKKTGKNFKIVFKIVNCRDYDAKFLECYDSGIGIQLYAHEAEIDSEQNAVTTPYAEDRYIELEFDIYPDSGFRYLQTWLDGVLSGCQIYAENDNFTQPIPKNIVIGSPDCDVYIYMLKVYPNNLTRDNHIENFIADAPNAQEMVRRYDRNDILSESGEISYEKLPEKNPECRTHLWDIPRMTEGKKDYVDGCSYQQIYNAGEARDQLTAENVRICIQGTSSVNYKESAANTDGNFLSGFTDGNGDHIDGYSMEDDSIPVNYFNTKVNVASCENINNRCLAEWYNRFQPYKTLWRQKNPKARDCMEHHMGVQFIRDRSHGLFSDDNYHMYAICNMGNSKKNLNVFHDADNPLECCIETLDNNSTHCLMLDPAFSVADLDSEDFFEFRYPDDPTDAMKQAFVSFVQWMASSNPNSATNEALESSVTYGAYTFKGTNQDGEVLAGLTISDYAGTYTHDTYEYRMAKMLNECEDHLIMDAMVYHYVFVEQHTMVDNVCKNTFWGTEDLIHWHLAKNYDNDTADGNNNTGKLVIPYGCEGMDTLGDGDVFNGKTAVWWGFIYGLYEARRTMWISRESAGAWDANAYLAFAKEQQDIIPERVWNEDYWYKYLRLYETKGVTTYIPMLEGGKKTHQRESFATNNEYYMAGQYMGVACTSRSITLRGYTPSAWAGVEPKSEVSVQLYTKGYIVVQIGNIYKRIKADKGVFYTVIFSDSGDMNDTVINLHGANLIQAVGDISCLYVGRSDFAAATRLRSLQIGSSAEGYQNNNLTEIGFGTNTMLEYLYIQNCPNVKSSLDLTGCQALIELDARGSGFTGFTFAVGATLKKAYLPKPASLSLRSLYDLEEFSLESYDNLTTLRLEDCPGINSLQMVQQAENLLRVRILGVDWTMQDTDTLDWLLGLMGLDESNYNTEVSVLAGNSYVPVMRQLKLEEYNTAWPELIISYGTMVQQYTVTYVNMDGTVLYTTAVDRGSAAPDPVTEGLIPAPTMESSVSTVYTYSGWDQEVIAVLSNMTITAVYTETPRKYTVQWLAAVGVVLQTAVVDYASEAVYTGNTPERTDEEDSYVYYLFDGWDKWTGCVTGDMTVYAKWQRGETPPEGTALNEMAPAEIYAMKRAGMVAQCLDLKDRVSLTWGHDAEYDNVESQVLVESEYVLDGVSTYVDTGIQLFDTDKSWTIAIDFEFLDSTNGATLMQCFEEDGYEGFRLRHNGSNAVLNWGSLSSGAIASGNTNRQLAVLRYHKGEMNVTVYSSNTSGDAIAINSVTKTRKNSTEATLVLGASKTIDGVFENFANGVIYWAKIWYEDLGDTVCQKLASWPHEVIEFEYCGAKRYRLSSAVSTYCQGSFIANNTLRQLHNMNSTNITTGGWEASGMRAWIKNRILPAMPDIWQLILAEVRISSTAGDMSYEIVTTEDKLYIPSVVEMSGSTAEPWVYEGSHITWFTTNASRCKFRWMPIPEGATIYTSATDPALISGNNVKEGDVWINTSNSSIGYIYYRGVWASAYNFWLRGASVSGSTHFTLCSATVTSALAATTPATRMRCASASQSKITCFYLPGPVRADRDYNQKRYKITK